MGEIKSRVLLENHDDKVLSRAGQIDEKRVRILEIEAVVDTGAVMLLLPLDIVEKLGLQTNGLPGRPAGLRAADRPDHHGRARPDTRPEEACSDSAARITPLADA
ncbi:MAG: hypothetical protein HY549_01975 [Elusimicrobia bacterium]|nr:hypothetical protein [Elusimicrobiota bacterium]